MKNWSTPAGKQVRAPRPPRPTKHEAINAPCKTPSSDFQAQPAPKYTTVPLAHRPRSSLAATTPLEGNGVPASLAKLVMHRRTTLLARGRLCILAVVAMHIPTLERNLLDRILALTRPAKHTSALLPQQTCCPTMNPSGRLLWVIGYDSCREVQSIEGGSHSVSELRRSRRRRPGQISTALPTTRLVTGCLPARMRRAAVRRDGTSPPQASAKSADFRLTE